MNLDQIKQLAPIDRLVYWIDERESIRFKKENGYSKPWTADPILQRYRFCNVVRIEDKVSRWLLYNWYQPFFNHPSMLVAVCIARFFNLPSALEIVGFPIKLDLEDIKVSLRLWRGRGEKLFNSAYMVRGNDGVDKVSSVIDYTIQPLIDDPPEILTSSMQVTHQAIKSRYGFGSFMAGQVVADLRWAMHGAWMDKRKWAPVGPGSSRGMYRLEGKPPKPNMKQAEFLEKLLELIDFCKPKLPRNLVMRMEAMDWQNCLCEYDKYCRVLFGEGKPKQRYLGI